MKSAPELAPAAGGGDAETIDGGEVIGPCPSCGADLSVALAKNPRTGRVERALMHPVPFCTYYGETHPDAIEHAIERVKKGELTPRKKKAR
jgi:hypothetical protein